MFLADKLSRAYLPRDEMHPQTEFETINALHFLPMIRLESTTGYTILLHGGRNYCDDRSCVSWLETFHPTKHDADM